MAPVHQRPGKLKLWSNLSLMVDRERAKYLALDVTLTPARPIIYTCPFSREASCPF